MKVRDKIKQKKALLAAKKTSLPDDPVSETKLYSCRCIVCKQPYQTRKELDLDGQGRCPPCQEIREREIAEIVRTVPPMPKESRPLSYDETPGIVYNGIKFIPLK